MSLVDFAIKGYGVRLTAAEAAELKKIWMKAFPEMELFFQMAADKRASADIVRERAETAGLDLEDSVDATTLANAVAGAIKAKALELEDEGRMEEAQTLLMCADGDVRDMVSGTGRYICKTFTGRTAANKTFNACANMHFQGPCADAAKLALFGQWLRGWKPIAFIHDEVINELRLCRTIGATAMEQAAAWVSDAQTLFRHVNLKSEPALMLRWDKGAEACFDGAGALQIWTPDMVCDEEKAEEILKSASAADWRELFTSKGGRYGVQPRRTADEVAAMCDID